MQYDRYIDHSSKYMPFFVLHIQLHMSHHHSNLEFHANIPIRNLLDNLKFNLVEVLNE